MEKDWGQIKVAETDDGFRIEVTGKKLKDMLSCCCIPFVRGGKSFKVECCPLGEQEK